MKKFLNDIFDTVFPRSCILCGDVLMKGEHYICRNCFCHLPRTNKHLLADNRVEQIFWGRFPLGRATSFLYYTKGGDVRRLLFDLKYWGNRYIGETLGGMMAREISRSGFFNSIDLMIPIPLHQKKQKKRGYNQSEWICKGISKVMNIPVYKNAVVRSGYTETQTHKSRYERLDNVCNVFCCTQPNALVGKHVLLVDDVLTTGATVTSCADVLANIDHITISVLTLAFASD